MPVRRDLFSDGSIAHSSLKRQVAANSFTDGTLCRVAIPVARLSSNYKTRDTDRQILYGHPVLQLEAVHGLSRDETSGYVGYVTPDDLAVWAQPTHRVTARSTLLFDAADFKSPQPLAIPCGALLRVTGDENGYAKTHDGRYGITAHLAPVDEPERDLAKTAETLIGTPYLWGGNSAFGIDCSGLVQLACQAAHIACPGDSDQQMETLGTPLPAGTKPERNDLMFWKGHVAIVFDDRTLIHANAHQMAVGFEPLDEAVARIAASGDGPVLAHKRL